MDWTNSPCAPGLVQGTNPRAGVPLGIASREEHQPRDYQASSHTYHSVRRAAVRADYSAARLTSCHYAALLGSAEPLQQQDPRRAVDDAGAGHTSLQNSCSRQVMVPRRCGLSPMSKIDTATVCFSS